MIGTQTFEAQTTDVAEPAVHPCREARDGRAVDGFLGFRKLFLARNASSGVLDHRCGPRFEQPCYFRRNQASQTALASISDHKI